MQAAYQCLQFEFDSSLKDRTFILSQYLLLHQLRPKDSPLSFACFSHIMDVMSNEAKACLELVPIMPFAQLVKRKYDLYNGLTNRPVCRAVTRSSLKREV